MIDLHNHILRYVVKLHRTDPDIETVYRSKYIGDDVTRASFTRGIEFSLTLTGEINF